MAYVISKPANQDVDLPLTNFPVSEDYFDRMSDISADTINSYLEYNKYISVGNVTMANKTLESDPKLREAFFNAEKYNQLRDAVIAIERYFLNQVTDLYTNITQSAVGLNDNPKAGTESSVAYSAQKINRLHNIREVTLNKANWGSTYPYSQKVTVNGITATDDVRVIGVKYTGTSEATDRGIAKAFSCLRDGQTEANAMTFYAKKKPEETITVYVQGA